MSGFFLLRNAIENCFSSVIPSPILTANVQKHEVALEREMDILVVMQPLNQEQLFASIRAEAASASATDNNASSDHTDTVAADFETVCHKIAAMGAQKLFYSPEGHRLLALLERVSESVPHLFHINVVTTRVKNLLLKLTNCPPENPGDEVSPFSPIDVAARIVSNVSAEQSRNRATEVVQFFMNRRSAGCAASAATLVHLLEFVVEYRTHFVDTNTAGLLWPGAVALSALVVAASQCPPSHEIMQQQTQQQFAEAFVFLNECLHRAAVVLEIGCGLGMLSCAVAAHLAKQQQQQQQKTKHAKKKIMLLTDLHVSAATAAKDNATNMLITNNKNSISSDCAVDDLPVDIRTCALDWRDQQMFHDVFGQVKQFGEPAMLVASEVIYDEAMGADVARLLGQMLHGGDSPFVAAFIVLMDFRVGISEFVSTCCDEQRLCCTRVQESELRDCVSVATGSGESLRAWSLFIVTANVSK